MRAGRLTATGRIVGVVPDLVPLRLVVHPGHVVEVQRGGTARAVLGDLVAEDRIGGVNEHIGQYVDERLAPEYRAASAR